MKINNFRGELTDISAKKEPLVQTPRLCLHKALMPPQHKTHVPWCTSHKRALVNLSSSHCQSGEVGDEITSHRLSSSALVKYRSMMDCLFLGLRITCFTWVMWQLQVAVFRRATRAYQWLFFSRSIGYITPKIIHFRYQKKLFSGSKYPKIFHLIFKTEALVCTRSGNGWFVHFGECICAGVTENGMTGRCVVSLRMLVVIYAWMWAACRRGWWVVVSCSTVAFRGDVFCSVLLCILAGCFCLFPPFASHLADVRRLGYSLIFLVIVVFVFHV